MTIDGAGPEETSPRARQRSRKAVTTAAVLLLVGGGVTVAYGLAGQDPAPVAPPVAASSPAPAGLAPSPTPTRTPPSISLPERTPEPAPSSPPVAVHIPAIEVASELTVVGLNPDGTLEVPRPGPDYDKAAWYEGSPIPGGMGPAVILGHVDGVNGPSVFYRLGTLAPGDTVEVARQDGTTVTFVVDSVQSFPKDAFPTDLVYGDTTRPELRLITCSGEFDRAAQSHVDNTVVFAHQI